MTKSAWKFPLPVRFRTLEPEETPVPPARLAQVQGVQNRRVSDAVEDAFRRACLAGDLPTARDLMIVFERMHQRGKRLGGDRRTWEERLQRARHELARSEALESGTAVEVERRAV